MLVRVSPDRGGKGAGSGRLVGRPLAKALEDADAFLFGHLAPVGRFLVRHAAASTNAVLVQAYHDAGVFDFLRHTVSAVCRDRGRLSHIPMPSCVPSGPPSFAASGRYMSRAIYGRIKAICRICWWLDGGMSGAAEQGEYSGQGYQRCGTRSPAMRHQCDRPPGSRFLVWGWPLQWSDAGDHADPRSGRVR